MGRGVRTVMLLRRAMVAVGCVAVTVLGSAVPAQAHPPGIQVAVDYRTVVTGIVPALTGVRARYVADGSRLELRNDSGRTVEVLGYQGEPMLQVRPDGVWQNIRAPSLYVDSLGAPVNPEGDPRAAPQWQQISTRPLARWQDHRAWWHGSPPQQVQADPHRVQRVLNWQVPVRASGTAAQISGTLDWVPPPRPGRWWTAVFVLAVAVAALGLAAPISGRTAVLVRAGLGGVAVAVGVATAGYPLLVIAANVEPRAGSVAAAVASQLLPVLAGLALVGCAGLVWAGRQIADFAVATLGGCAALVTTGTAAVFAHPVAPIAGDGWWARLLHVVVFGGCIGLVAAGVLRIRRSSARPASLAASAS
ncbi:MAG TPA: hypothetical protein VH502_07835 [Actinoplanes sp.]|jgi:hypothetical protein